MDIYEEGLINGLLQTREYMEGSARTNPFDPDDALAAIPNKLERQRLAFEEGDPPEMRVILNEHSLLRLRATPWYEPQLQHMVDLIDRYGIGIYVLPITTGIQSAQWGSFTIMGFDHPRGFELAYMPSMAGASWVENLDQITRCRMLFKATLRECLELGAYVDADERMAEVQP